MEDIVPIDEIDTLPPDVRLRSNLNRGASGRSTVGTLPNSSIEGYQGISQQVEERRLAATQLPIGMKSQGFSIWYCFDNVRWWLLYPSRLEFLLWFIGVIILISATIFFTLLLIVSLGVFGSGVCR